MYRGPTAAFLRFVLMCLPTAYRSRVRPIGAQQSRMDGSGLPRPREKRKERLGPDWASDLGFCPSVGRLLERQRATLEPSDTPSQALRRPQTVVIHSSAGGSGVGTASSRRRDIFSRTVRPLGRTGLLERRRCPTDARRKPSTVGRGLDKPRPGPVPGLRPRRCPSGPGTTGRHRRPGARPAPCTVP